MLTSAVVMYCGPYDEGNQPPTRRIDHAIALSRRFDLPLFIAGDAFEGKEIDRFSVRAWEAGVASVIPAFDPRHCTLADAQAVAREILSRDLACLSHLHLVTDWWHMDRASTMLERELAQILGRIVRVQPSSVFSGPAPSRLVHENERQGLNDYLVGTYGQRQVVDPLIHRPVQPTL
ncbi:hypothetical protein EPN81_01850 [Patescibacteria group bacterium]|nr:MAG: hypothetical protein EPN81_01850 [Patescibacteria group bacterium]